MAIEDYARNKAPQGLQQFNNFCVLLFWDVTKQEWTTKWSFKPRSSEGTEGMRWFNYPTACTYDGSKWWHFTFIEQFEFDGKNKDVTPATGTCDVPGAGSGSASTGTIPGSPLGVKKAIANGKTECVLVTERTVGRWPYLQWKNNPVVCLPFKPFYQWRGARGYG